MFNKAYAGPIDIEYDSVGNLPDATFGGSGISNDNVAITSYIEQICTTRCRDSGVIITLGLQAHGRYNSSLVSTDGAGTYYAPIGASIPNGSSLMGSSWNFDYYINVEGSDFSIFDFRLLYDFNPAVANEESDHGILDINSALATFPGSTLADISRNQSSQNLMFNFLSTPSPFITVPTDVSSFDPNAVGEYTFALAAYRGNQEVSRTAIRVVAQSVDVPEPSSFAILMLGLIAMGRRINS